MALLMVRNKAIVAHLNGIEKPGQCSCSICTGHKVRPFDMLLLTLLKANCKKIGQVYGAKMGHNARSWRREAR